MIPEADAVEVVAGIITCNGVVTGIVEVDAVVAVVADSVAYNGVIAGMVEVDAVVIVVTDSVACNSVIVWGYFDSSVRVIAWVSCLESFKCNSICT